MMKLKATNPLVLFVGALAIGLAGCADDVIITEPPPPPPPPPPEAAEISIISIAEFDDGAELGELDEGPVGSAFDRRFISVNISYDTGGFEAAALDILVDSDVVPCQTFSGQAAVGFSADVQEVSCTLDTAEGIGECVGQTLMGRFENGDHTIAARLTLQDGSTVSATRVAPLNFQNENTVAVVSNDIGPRVVGLDEQGWWGGPIDLSWYACPILFDSSLDDFGGVCEVTITNNGGMLFTSTSSSVTDDAAPYEAMALYRDVPTSDPTWVDEESRNEDSVEDTDINVWANKVLACDGTNITSDFSDLFDSGDERNIDLSAPLCDDDPCEVWIDDEYPINDGNAAGFTNNLFSDGDFDLRDDSNTIVDDDGVGLVLGTTTVLAAWDYADGDVGNLVLFLTPVFGVADLTEDDACGDDGTTDQALGLNTFATAYGQCAATGEAGAPVDAYTIQIAEVGDLLGNKLSDGTMDLQIEDEFITELDAPSGVVISGQLGADFTGPVIDELMPDATTPVFVWNPDLTFDGVDPDLRGCDPNNALPGDPLDETLCENVMFEALDPDLASGDPGAGVEDTGCGPATNPATTTCADGNGDGELVFVEIDDSPGDDFNDFVVQTAQAFGTLAADGMFSGYICNETADAGLTYACDGNNDGTYALTHSVPDKAQVENNVSTASYSVIIDTNQPIIGFGGITGLNSSNAATVEFVLDASVVDRNGDGTAVTSAVVQVTAFSVAGLNTCDAGGEDLVDEDDVLVTPEGGNDDATGATVIVDVTTEVNAGGGDFDVLFTAANLTPFTDVLYCFTITADDGAERKDGTDDGLEIGAVAGKTFQWQ